MLYGLKRLPITSNQFKCPFREELTNIFQSFSSILFFLWNEITLDFIDINKRESRTESKDTKNDNELLNYAYQDNRPPLGEKSRHFDSMKSFESKVVDTN